MAGIHVRPAGIEDAAGIAGLVTELGYPTTSGQMRERLEAIFLDPEYSTFVACEDERVVGFVGTRLGPLYESDGRYGQIMALAVASTHRRRGVGQTLIQRAESMLLERGARVLVVGTGNQRRDAHSFYEKHGYVWAGRRYRKSPGGSA